MASLRRIVIIVTILTVLSLVHCQDTEPRLIISPPQSYLSTPAGKPFGLVCSGEPENKGFFNEMKWYKPDGELIPEGTPGVKMFGESSLKLSFVNPTGDESGTYRCTALYSSSKSLEVEVKINFYEDIKFEDCAEVQDLVVGKEGRINCRPIGNPQPAINWEKNKMRVPSERIMITPSGIVISSVSPEDAGLYTVEAFVLATGINKYRNITVNVLTPPKIIELPEDVTAIQGQDKDIICRADGSEPLIYSWIDPNFRDLSSVDGFKVDGGRLTMYKVDKNAGGQYKCEVSNRAGKDEEFVRVEVQVPPTIVLFENLTREETKEALFECRAEGEPKPTLSIRRDNSFQPIEDGQEERIEVEEVEENGQKVVRLSISNVKRSDDGLYYCKASNAAGDVERTGHLEVQFRPDMSATPFTTVKAWSANPANLSCIAEANPNATLTWKFQNEPIELDEQRYKLYGGVSYSNLLVYTDKRAQYEIFGVYTCEARNKLGENSININLEEATAPGQVTQIVFDKVTSTTITFRLMGPGNTGGLPIIAYIMRYKLAEEPEDRTITIEWSKDSPYILSELKPRAKYQFSVAARNIVGEGSWKTADYIMPEETVPEPPTIITEPETISDYPDRFEVRWNVPSDNGEPILHFHIRYFKVEREIKGWVQVGKANEHTVRNWMEKPSFEIAGLASDTYYKIEIRAANKIGNSIPETVVIKTRAGETTNDPLSKDGEELPLPIVIAIVLVALLVFLVILDVTCFFRFHCGLLHLMRYRTCGRSSEKMPSDMEDGRAWNRDARPADLIIDENFKNKSPKGSKTSIGKSSPV